MQYMYLRFGLILDRTFIYRLSIRMFSSSVKMIRKSTSCLIGVCQMRSTNIKEENFFVAKNLIEKAATRGAQMIFLPEGCDYIAESKKESVDLAEPENGPTLRQYSELAKKLSVWLSLGGIHIKRDSEAKIRNTHYIIDSSGEVVGQYEKTHLFNVQIPEKNLYLQESKYVHSGQKVPDPVMTPCGIVGMGICYDMRFPELSFLERQSGAEILTFPSAFTVATGLAHWHVLLRARAIECQSYVVAAAQVGHHNSKRSSFGHALVVDPWGTVVAEVSEGTNIAIAEIDLSYLHKVREEMPVMNHRRLDLYSLQNKISSTTPRMTAVIGFPSNFVHYPFGEKTIPGSCIFLQTSQSIAFVNKKPFTNGHVLISPKKPTKRFCQLSAGEVGDLAQAVYIAFKVLNTKYQTSKFQIAIQDGELAGQTVEHVHVHLVPILEENFIENHETKHPRVWRELEDMEGEASDLRGYTLDFHQNNDWLSTSNIPRRLELSDADGSIVSSGGVMLPEGMSFINTHHSYGFIPANPILPDHICICAKNSVGSFDDLSPAEVTDLFLCVHETMRFFESHESVTSTTVYMKTLPDEKEVPVICAHAVPRRQKDLQENDDIYCRLITFKPKVPDSESKMLSSLKDYFKV